MPTPPKKSIGGRASEFQRQSFNDMNYIYDVLVRGIEFKESEEFFDLPEEEQEDFLNEINSLEFGYEILLKRVRKVQEWR